MEFESTTLSSGLPVIVAPAPGTPRMSLAVTVNGGTRREALPGMAKLAQRLLLKGTERRNAEALARELDAHAIDLRDIVLSDSAVLQAVFLNRELDHVLDLLQDMLLHSTFADFDKERTKMAGEIGASLDLPAEQAQDLLMRTLFEGHPYGHTSTRVLEGLDGMDVEATRGWFAAGLSPRDMNVVLVGDTTLEAVLPRLEAAFGGITADTAATPWPALTRATGDRVVTRARPDAQQAQVFQGWYAPGATADDRPAIGVMNTILGAGGLSSRLFVELRDKQGLAYSVRSQYFPMAEVGEFLITIGTSPENIARARAGFIEQLARIQQEPVSFEELRSAKGRVYGAYVMGHETTSQQCLDLALNQIIGLGPDFSARLLQRVQGVTVEDVQRAARLIVPPSVTAIVAREEALPAE